MSSDELIAKASRWVRKKRHGHIVKLVEQMLAATEKLSKSKTDAEVNRLELQCESLDRQIDAAVYELYGLTMDAPVIASHTMSGRDAMLELLSHALLRDGFPLISLIRKHLRVAPRLPIRFLFIY